MAIVAGCFLGGLAGYSSICLLEALLPRLHVERAWGDELMVCGAALGSLGAIAVVARFCWSQLKQGGDAKIEAFVARIEKLWRASST